MQQQIQAPQSQAKQNNLIRKTAIQTFQPIIIKLQQHISYLLAQTAKLRQKNQSLQKTISDHNVLNKSIEQLRQDISTINMNILDQTQKVQTDKIAMKSQFMEMEQQIRKLKEELKEKQRKITTLFQKNDQQKDQFKKTNQQFKQLVERCGSQVAAVQSHYKQINLNSNKFKQSVQSSLSNLQQMLKERDTFMQNSSSKLQLYMNERDQLRQMIAEIYCKVQKTINMERYEHDWRIMRMESQSVRKDTRRMIDQALTPEIRKFLPQIMQRIEQVRKVNALEMQLQQQQNKQTNSQKLQQQLTSQQRQTEKKLKLLHQQMQKQHQEMKFQFNQKFKEGGDTTTQALTTIQTQTTDLVLTKQRQIKQQISSLIDNNKQTIYKHIVDLIPQQQKDFYNKMKDFLPLLQQTKKEILTRCDEITQFGQKLQQRLQSFNNKITKIKGDVSVQIQTLKKKNKLIDNSILIVAENFKEVGKVLSIFCQMFLLNYSLSFDTYDQEVYVAYNDGIIYQNCSGQAEISYRKFKCTRQQLRRSALTFLIKLTDILIGAEQYAFLSIGLSKPSQHFKIIKQQVLLSFVADSVPNTARKLQRRPSPKPKQKQKQKQRQKIPIDTKLPSIENNFSKTIDFSVVAQNSRQSPSLTLTNFQSIQQKKQRPPYKGRYSQMK